MVKNIIRTVLVAAVILWMGVIFSFSCENGGESAESSGGFIHTVISFFDKDFSTLPTKRQTEIIETYDHFVRKTAHFTIYAILGGLLSLTLFSFGLKNVKLYLISVILSGLYAISDEIHQYFVPGRACMIRDMILDTCGGAVGAVVGMLILYLIMRQLEKKKA